jgi:hypothetical protein
MGALRRQSQSARAARVAYIMLLRVPYIYDYAGIRGVGYWTSFPSESKACSFRKLRSLSRICEQRARQAYILNIRSFNIVTGHPLAGPALVSPANGETSLVYQALVKLAIVCQNGNSFGRCLV